MIISDNYDFDYFKEKSISLEYLDMIISTHKKPVHIFFVYSFGKYSELLEIKIGHDCVDTSKSSQYLGLSIGLKIYINDKPFEIHSKDLGIGDWQFTKNRSFLDKKDAQNYLEFSKTQPKSIFSNRNLLEVLL